MKILVDIKHPAQLNLFKAFSKQLKGAGWQVTICYLERGKLPAIIKAEYEGFELIPVGKSYGTRWSILWHGNIMRTFTFLKLIKKNKYNICVAASSLPLALACKISSTPIIQFYDDPERKRINYLNAKFSNQLFFPPIVEKDAKTSVFNCLKEWSYLSPGRFKPDPHAPGRYGVQPHEYVFVREVSNKSFNYYDQADGIVCNASSEIDKNAKVILSLEDKSISKKFPAHWIVLREPVDDIHSLIYYSKLVVFIRR
jgi:predicted glycosyltransferase